MTITVISLLPPSLIDSWMQCDSLLNDTTLMHNTCNLNSDASVSTGCRLNSLTAPISKPNEVTFCWRRENSYLVILYTYPRLLAVWKCNAGYLSFAAETSLPSSSHGEPAASSRDALSSWDAPRSCIWNSCTQPYRGDLGREQDARGKGKLDFMTLQSFKDFPRVY